MNSIYNAFGDAILFNPLTASTTIAYNWWNEQPLLSNPVTGRGQSSTMSPLLVAALVLGGLYIVTKVKW